MKIALHVLLCSRVLNMEPFFDIYWQLNVKKADSLNCCLLFDRYMRAFYGIVSEEKSWRKDGFEVATEENI